MRQKKKSCTRSGDEGVGAANATGAIPRLLSGNRQASNICQLSTTTIERTRSCPHKCVSSWDAPRCECWPQLHNSGHRSVHSWSRRVETCDCADAGWQDRPSHTGRSLAPFRYDHKCTPDWAICWYCIEHCSPNWWLSSLWPFAECSILLNQSLKFPSRLCQRPRRIRR